MCHAAPFKETFQNNLKGWHIAHYRFEHPDFDTDWDRSLVKLHRQLELQLTPQHQQPNRFLGASIRREQPTGFGRYSARLKASSAPGVVTGFFIYTGPYYGTQHDEIDIEILGKAPKQVQVGWFTNGQDYHRTIPLGFDASEDFHTYAFEWTAQHIRWFVDDKLIFETGPGSNTLPQTPGRLFANIWVAKPHLSDWAGVAVANTNTKAIFENITFEPF